MEQQVRNIKCTVVGDGYVGKTSLLFVYFTKTKLDPDWMSHMPWTPDTYKELEIDNIKVKFTIFDTPGQDEYDQLRPLSYPKTDVFLICFAVDNRINFENVIQKWVPELTHYCPGVPFLLVGTKSDLRKDDLPNIEPSISYEEGLELSKKIKAKKYMECSALLKEEVDSVFEEALRVILFPKREKRNRRNICSFI